MISVEVRCEGRLIGEGRLVAFQTETVRARSLVIAEVVHTQFTLLVPWQTVCENFKRVAVSEFRPCCFRCLLISKLKIIILHWYYNLTRSRLQATIRPKELVVSVLNYHPRSLICLSFKWFLFTWNIEQVRCWIVLFAG